MKMGLSVQYRSPQHYLWAGGWTTTSRQPVLPQLKWSAVTSCIQGF